MSAISFRPHFGGSSTSSRKTNTTMLKTIQPNSSITDEVQFSGKAGKNARKLGATMVLVPLLAYGGAEVTTDVNPFDLTGHYILGDGQPLKKNFQSLDLGDIGHSQYFPHLQTLADEMKRNNLTQMSINYQFGIVLPGLDEYTLGGLKVNLTGEMVCKGNKWELKNGKITGEPDYFDYDVNAGHRDGIAEGGTRLFNKILPGKPYWVNFDGAQSYKAEGKC